MKPFLAVHERYFYVVILGFRAEKIIFENSRHKFFEILYVFQDESKITFLKCRDAICYSSIIFLYIIQIHNLVTLQDEI